MRPEFVDHIPEQLTSGVLYIAIRFATVVHLCACGCGNEVVTPLSPAEWELTYDGDTVSLFPSVGNWALPCRSHYWIRCGEVRWAEDWSDWEIAEARLRDSWDRANWYDRHGKYRRSDREAPEPSGAVEHRIDPVEGETAGLPHESVKGVRSRRRNNSFSRWLLARLGR